MSMTNFTHHRPSGDSSVRPASTETAGMRRKKSASGAKAASMFMRSDYNRGSQQTMTRSAPLEHALDVLDQAHGCSRLLHRHCTLTAPDELVLWWRHLRRRAPRTVNPWVAGSIPARGAN